MYIPLGNWSVPRFRTRIGDWIRDPRFSVSNISPISEYECSGGSRGGARGARSPLFWQKKKWNNEITQEEEKPAGEAMLANQFCFNISQKPPPPPSLAQVWICHWNVRIIVEKRTYSKAISTCDLSYRQVLEKCQLCTTGERRLEIYCFKRSNNCCKLHPLLPSLSLNSAYTCKSFLSNF